MNNPSFYVLTAHHLNALRARRAALKERLKVTLEIKRAIRTGYAWPGGYKLAVVMNDGGALCTDCVRKNWGQVAHDTLKSWRTGWDAAGVQVFYEGGNHCDNCNCNLDAYQPHTADEY
jgi:hypothetical protein